MVLNLRKSHYLVTNKNIANDSIKLGKKILQCEAEEKLVGIKTDKDLNF